MQNEDYEQALSIFEKLGEYKDSLDKALECKNIIETTQEKKIFENAAIGDTIYFGSYEQDNNESNGKEDIEWIVLAKEDNQILVISKYVIDYQAYESNNWRNSSLRKWLNENFMKDAFAIAEIEMIATTLVENPRVSKDEESNTQDKLFLLNIKESENYFTSDLERQCKATPFAKDRGVLTKQSSDNCGWWLRSRGMQSDSIAYVSDSGTIINLGTSTHDNSIGIRPALWINLES